MCAVALHFLLQTGLQQREVPDLSHLGFAICPKCRFKSPKDEAPLGALISIGPKTDAVIREGGIPDQIIPYLRHLVRLTRSERWAAELQKKSWNLSSDEASSIARALLEDSTVHLRAEVGNFNGLIVHD
jgi:hypothetical protein